MRKISPSHRPHSTHHGINEHNYPAYGNTKDMRNAKNSVEGFSDGGKLCRHISHHAGKNDDNRNHAQDMSLVIKIVFKIIGKGDGVMLF